MCLVVATLAVAVGTGGFSSAAADRSVEVAVVGDDDAYLGFQQFPVTTNGTTNLTVTVSNRFPPGTTLDTVKISVNDKTRYVDLLDSGEDESVSFEFVACDDTIYVEAVGGSVTVSFSRPVDCS